MKHAFPSSAFLASTSKKYLITLALLTEFLLPTHTQAVSNSLTPDSSGRFQNDWMRGVDLYDLLLINRHICGVTLLDSPLKLLAADVSNSNMLSMVDIDVLRKVILGKIDTFPDNGSWKYIDAAYVFKNPADPFEEINRAILGKKATVNGRSFIAVKIGDVNNSHTPDPPPGMMRTVALPIGIGKPSHRAGEFVTIPVSYEGTESLAAVQLGLQFDADNWELLEPSTADLPDYEPGCFNLREAEKGRIKFVWFTPWPKEQLQQGRTLFYLTFRRKSAQADQPLILRTYNDILENTGFGDSGQPYGLVATEQADQREQPSATAVTSAWTVGCAPNPVTDLARLQIESPSAQAVSVWVFNGLGVRTYYRELSIPAGATEVSIPEVAQWPAGIYTWKVKSGKEKQQGQFVKR